MCSRVLLYSYVLLVKLMVSGHPATDGDRFQFCCSKAPSPTISPRISQDKCTEFDMCEADVVSLVVSHGEVVEEKKYPHMAAVGYSTSSSSDNYQWLCGATLISDRFLLTAAHCTINREFGGPKVVRLGSKSLSQGSEGLLQAPLAAILVHPSFRSPLVYHDIALLQLSTPVRFSTYIRPVCLHQSFQPNASSAIAMGWGALSYGGERSDVLMEVELQLEDLNVCAKAFNVSRRLTKGVKRSQICTKGSTKDTCQGDSGGPLGVKTRCGFELIGITSYGVQCATNNPAIYTRVHPYLDWIEGIVWPTTNSSG